ncbi:MAG: rRNA maturation RNase YbeY [Elusimicrobia bacterium]|nr:rRNA maturation RNase YbeY [Elusimicrobiota bacterium]
MTVRVFGANLLPASARKPSLVRKAVRAALKLEGVKARGELSLVFLDRRRMRELNRVFLKHDYDTDVIAFRYDDGRRSKDVPFGDVYISAHMARRQARELKHSVLDEALTLAVHGTLHLLGYDDRTERQRRKMFARQDRILRRN